MKHLNATHRLVNAGASGGVAISLESERIAMEGFVDGVKAKWEAFKKSTAPTDHEHIVHKLMLIPKMKQDLAKIKSQISSTGDADIHNVTKRANKTAAQLPVVANNPQQLLVELEKLRKGLELIGRKAQQATTPEQIKAVREQLAVIKKRKGQVNPNMDWTKDQILKFLDALAQYCDTSLAVGRLYLEAQKKAKRDNPQAVMESYVEVMAMEGFEDITSVALESLKSAVGGLLLLFAGIVIYVFSIVAVLYGVVLFLGGAFLHGLLLFMVGNAAHTTSQRMLDRSVDMIYGE